MPKRKINELLNSLQIFQLPKFKTAKHSKLIINLIAIYVIINKKNNLIIHKLLIIHYFRQFKFQDLKYLWEFNNSFIL